ncbi:MAG TPA: hypothetical protein VJ725_26435 [Thermoanaerobaculia bacterium]|nr:hypothetical protein [Thermoanaerobaculia bacterium]
MRHASPVLLWVAAASVLMCAAQLETRTTLRLAVPREVSAQAASRAAGDASSPPPILMLEDLEVGDEEGLTVLVLGPAEPGSGKPRPVLGQAATVGLPQKQPKAPLQKLTLAVPLNDEALRLVAGKSKVVLTLEVEGSPGRSPLKFKRAYFDPGKPDAPGE